MEWTNNEYIEGTYVDFKYMNNIAAFDLDGTLIRTKSGAIFPKDENDWVFFSKNVVSKLKELVDDDFCIIIISNQAGMAKGRQDENVWKKKLELICQKLRVPIKIFASRDHDHYRKPYMSFFDLIKKNVDVSNKSFYCGDASGREKDFSDTDRKFALNNNIKFMLPEILFDNAKETRDVYGVIQYDVDLEKLIKLKPTEIKFDRKNKEMIIMIGMPATGKSYFVEKYLVPQNYVRINMDTLKTKAKCLKECVKQIEQKNNVVIDNTNPNKITRKEYIDIAKKYNYSVRCIKINCDKNVAYHTAHYRSYKSNGVIKSIPMMVYHMYNKKYEDPEKSEGINEIIEINFSPPNDPLYFKYYY